jgi:cytolysin-activating lysine-acyltransferase
LDRRQHTSGALAALDATERYTLIGELVELSLHSGVLREIEIQHIPEVFLRPYDLGQLRRWKRGGQVIGVATWAWLNDETAQMMLADGGVAPDAWQSGDQLWFIDVIAPFGDMREISRDLRSLFPGITGHSVRWNEDGSVKKVGRFHM